MNILTSKHFWESFTETLLKCGWSQQAATSANYITRIRIVGGYYL